MFGRLPFVVVCLALLGATVLAARPYVTVPGGVRLPPSCVHHVPAGAHVERHPKSGAFVITPKNGATYTLPLCTGARKLNNLHEETGEPLPVDAQPAELSFVAGWQVWTSFQNAGNKTFTTFNGNFTVPTAPAHFGDETGIIYLFTGLQNTNWVPGVPKPPITKGFEIIQPVLQYGGGSSNGGGNYWGVCSWYVTVDAGALWSDMIKLSAGDEIYGVMQLVNQTAHSACWLIDSVVEAQQKHTPLTVCRPRLINNPWAYVTLESYDIGDCNWFPTGTSSAFTDMILADASGVVTPSWTSHANKAHCNAGVSVVSGAAVSITFS